MNFGKHYSDMNVSELKNYLQKRNISITFNSVKELRNQVANHIILSNISQFKSLQIAV